MIWIMTDPRFWGWLWEIENEIRSLVPIVYYHVWDNYPHPYFNRNNYLSNDHIAAISKVTYDIVRTVSPEVSSTYLPHAVDTNVFRPMSPEKVSELRKQHIHPDDQDKVVFFWNNRNARRKQSGSLVYWFKEFLDKVGHDKAQLIMHTDPKDVHGQDLEHIIHHLGMHDRQVLLSTSKVSPDDLACFYNMVDCTVNISDAEGFGLGTLESMACGTPIIVNMTGGLQEQITNGTDWFGEAIFPVSKAIIGSQEVPYIYEDRISKNHFISALTKMFVRTTEERNELGMKGREHVMKNYNFIEFKRKWVELMDEVYNQSGSWDTRNNYSGIYFTEIAA
jgi:glycosyltransferase involved in cell wall biosynthesis